ncbi:GNAT family N-acetyltransferase [Bacillaceae bacterium IKA-2]|nr:GNAT family N-acetyltransferase [Bacillaceae bacterium IKA-2]
MKTLEQVKIVEYHEGFAKSVAIMWNESRENWGGDSVVTTEQDVIEKEVNSTNLHLFLAIVGEEVVGYCGLSEYREDEGALYIPLLNVHPAYHGLKIGKQLVLKAVEKTVALNWPRLDLFTWPGKTKAVPLYKKCGFFWEERDDSTHLMNFIPTVLQVEGLRPFFEKHDWYSTSQRHIDVKPDGIKEKGHTFYEYKWEASQQFVRVQFERTGRGLRLIETEDFLVEMELPDFKLLEKEEHIVTYRVVNKTETPIAVSALGVPADMVDHCFQVEIEVKEEWIGRYPLKLAMPQSEPNPWKTHPVVCANLQINGQTFPLKMGVFPKKAGKLDLRSIKKAWRINQKGTLFLDIESQLEEDATWTIKLPVNDVVKWEHSEVKTIVTGSSRVSIPLASQLLKNNFFASEVEVFVERSSGQRFSFYTRISLAFPGNGAKFGGETDEHWYGYNGPYYVQIAKRNHFLEIGSVRSNQDPLIFLTPKLGKPYSEEFSKKEASSIEYIECPEALVIKTSLNSEAFSPLVLNTYFKIYGDGLVELNYKVLNQGREAKNNISVLLPLVPKLNNMAIPQKDGVMIGDEVSNPFMDYIRDRDISEGWIFATTPEGETMGIAWPNDAVGRKDDWYFGIEYTIDKIKSNEEICLGPIQAGVNMVATWSDWREFVVGEEAKSMKEYPLFDLEAAGSEFISAVDETVDYSFNSMLIPYIHGRLTLKHEERTFVKEASIEECLTKINLQLDFQKPGVKCISGNFRSLSQVAHFHTHHLVKGRQEINIFKNEDSWSVNNGVISYNASATYFPGIYSLKFNGVEIFHHQYPLIEPKSWWNPWGGGLRYTFENISAYSMLKEETTIETITKLDQHGHSWTGLCLSTTFTEHETMKGITLRQYALTLPEVPVLVFFGEIHQNSGRTFTKELLKLEAFFKPAEQLSSCYVELPTAGKFHTYYSGVEEHVLKDTPFVTLGSDERKDKVTVIHSCTRKSASVYVNKDIMLVGSQEKWSASSGDMMVTKPTILLCGQENLSPVNHQLFQRLSFK